MDYYHAGLYFPRRTDVSWLADVPAQHRPDSVPTQAVYADEERPEREEMQEAFE